MYLMSYDNGTEEITVESFAETPEGAMEDAQKLADETTFAVFVEDVGAGNVGVAYPAKE